MLTKDIYYTIDKKSEAEYKSKNSRFIALAFPVLDENAIKEILQILWKQHHKATHICYAWRLGTDQNKYRANDDGEPSGTAGKPILGQIDSLNISDVAVFVIRYYGGTPLGTSGLIQAYKTSAKLALQEAKVISKYIMYNSKITFPYAAYSKVMQILMKHDADILNQVIDNICTITFSVRNAYKTKINTIFIETNLASIDE